MFARSLKEMGTLIQLPIHCMETRTQISQVSIYDSTMYVCVCVCVYVFVGLSSWVEGLCVVVCWWGGGGGGGGVLGSFSSSFLSFTASMLYIRFSCI